MTMQAPILVSAVASVKTAETDQIKPVTSVKKRSLLTTSGFRGLQGVAGVRPRVIEQANLAKARSFNCGSLGLAALLRP